jgi:hypothetical protein
VIKLSDLIKEENILVPRRSKEERSKNHLIAVQKQIQQHMKDGGKGDLDLSNTPIVSLPDGLEVGGTLNLRKTKITSLPDNLKVGEYLDLSFTPIAELPKGLEVGESLWLTNTRITSLPSDLKVKKYLNLKDTPIADEHTKEQIKQMIKQTVPGIEGDIVL